MSKKDKMVEEQPDITKRIADLERENEEKQRKIEQLEAEVSEAADLISGIQKERDESDEVERQSLIWKISQDSKGFLRKDHLANLGLHHLRLIRRNFDEENSSAYLEYFERRRRQVQADQEKTGMTVGEYDAKTKKYKGGI